MTLQIKKLKKLGFTQVQPRYYELEFSYDWHRFKKNDSCIDVTTEYDLNDTLKLQYVELNGEKLQGDPIGITELKFLIKLL